MKTYALVGLLVAPIAALALGVWAEFADLDAPLLLAVATPAMAGSLISAAYLARATARPLALVLVLLGGAIGLLTFSLAAGLYIAIHYARGRGLDLNGAGDGGSAGVFFVVHAVVGAIAGLGLGGGGAVLVGVGRAVGTVRAGGPRLQGPDSSLRSE